MDMPPEAKKTLLAGVVIAIVAAIFFVWNTRTPSSFQCPNDYQTAEGYIRGIAQWASAELEKSPNMTKEELLNERDLLFREHNCEPSRWPSLSEKT